MKDAVDNRVHPDSLTSATHMHAWAGIETHERKGSVEHEQECLICGKRRTMRKNAQGEWAEVAPGT
jgi:hypothetical protein